MRKLALLMVVAAGCGGGKKAPNNGDGSGSGPAEAGPTADAPALVQCTPTSGTTMSMQMIGRVNGVAIVATSPPGDGRLFVIEQQGRIRLFVNETLVSDPFLDISAKIVAGGEQGLLGLAFSPHYAENNTFYVWYTANNPNTADTNNPWVDVLEKYTTTSDPNKADPTSGQIILSIPDFASNHNGGMLVFDQNDYLLVGTGDGGSGGDPHHNAQNLDPNSADCQAHANQCQTMLGKILRIDVDHPANGKPYGIPADNPFLTSPTPEAYIIGVRNPWRWTFDTKTWDMWIADVGQDLVEELDVLPAGQQAGKNLGWSEWEADNCYGNYTPCSMTGFTFPQAEYWHAAVQGHTDSGYRAIIGGQVYRGPCYPDLTGYYFFSDNTAHTLERAQLNADGSVTIVDQTPPSGGWPTGPSSIHADARGELYETTTDGYVYHLEAGP